MKSKRQITEAFDALPFYMRLLTVIIGGALFGGIYRLARWYERRNTKTLIAGLVATFTGIGNLAIWIADIATTAKGKGITVFAE